VQDCQLGICRAIVKYLNISVSCSFLSFDIALRPVPFNKIVAGESDFAKDVVAITRFRLNCRLIDLAI
jgi:hypothetical protein